MKRMSKAGIVIYAVLSIAVCIASTALLSSCDIVPSIEAPHSNTNDPDSTDYDGPALPVAVLTGLPETETYATSISITVGGTGITSYVYSLDGTAYSGDTPVSTPITASGLETGTHSLSVLGKDADGWLQWESRATTYAWTILEQTDFTPPDMIAMDAFVLSYLVASASGASLTVSWEQPAEYVLVVRSLSDINGVLPTNGTAYAAGDTISACEVVYAGDAAEIEETEFSSDGTWRYRAFAYDEFYNYAGSDNQVSILVYKDAVYVHYDGSDSSGNGTSQAPLRTIQAGIDKAVDLGHLYEVRVAGATDYAANNYRSSAFSASVVTMASGISIYGGYSPSDWAESAREPDTYVSCVGYTDAYAIMTMNKAVSAAGLTGAVTIDGFRIDGIASTGVDGADTVAVYLGSCSAALTVSNCVVTGGTVSLSGHSRAFFVSGCGGGVTISGCSITGGAVSSSSGESSGISIEGSTVSILDNERVWGGSSSDGMTFGIYANNNTASTLPIIISGNDNGIDCISNADGETGTCRAIDLQNCYDVVIEESTIRSAQNTAASPRAINIYSSDGATTIRNCRVESHSSNANDNYCLFLSGAPAHTVTVYNCHILASAATGGTTAISVGIYEAGPNFKLYNNNIGAGPAGSTTGFSCPLYLYDWDELTAAVVNNNIFCVAGAQYNYGIFEAADGSISSFGTNNFMNCYLESGDCLYYDADGDVYYTTVEDLNTNIGGANINKNGVVFDEDGRATTGSTSIAVAGMNGGPEGWPFSTDKDGMYRTATGNTGWSIGPYEYDY